MPRGPNPRRRFACHPGASQGSLAARPLGARCAGAPHSPPEHAVSTDVLGATPPGLKRVAQDLRPGTSETLSDKGDPVARRARKAPGQVFTLTAELPKEGARGVCKPGVSDGRETQ